MFNNINSNYFWWLSFLPLEKKSSILPISLSISANCCAFDIPTHFLFSAAVFFCAATLPPSPQKKIEESERYGWESFCCQDKDSCESAAQLFIDTECCYCCKLVAYFLFWFIPREHLIYFCGVWMDKCFIWTKHECCKFSDIVINWFLKCLMGFWSWMWIELS